MMLGSFQIQTTPEDNAVATGAGLFLFTATAMTVRSWNKSHEKNVSATDIQKITRGKQARNNQNQKQLSAIEIQKIARGYTDRQSYNQQTAALKQIKLDDLQRQSDKNKLKQDFLKRGKQPILLLKNEPEFENSQYKSPTFSTYTSASHTKQEKSDALVRQAVIASASTTPTKEQVLLSTLCHKEQERKITDQIYDAYRKQDSNSLTKILDENIESITIDNRDAQKQSIDGKITKRYAIVPKINANYPHPNKSNILTLFHGTWSSPDGYGKDLTKPQSQDILQYAKTQAILNNAITYLDIAEWPGKLNLEQRKNAGAAIARETLQEIEKIEAKNPQVEVAIETISHSHGCNVANFYAEKLKHENIAVRQATFIGSPDLDVKATNIEKLNNYHGALDFTGRAGSMITNGGRSASLHKDASCCSANVINNAEIIIAGKRVNHIDIKGIFKHLPTVEARLQDNYNGTLHIDNESKHEDNLSYDLDGSYILPTDSPNYLVKNVLNNEHQKEYHQRYPNNPPAGSEANWLERFVDEIIPEGKNKVLKFFGRGPKAQQSLSSQSLSDADSIVSSGTTTSDDITPPSSPEYLTTKAAGIC
jgi:hypothetical protein